MATTALAQEKVWFDKPSYDKAECLHFERLAKGNGSNCTLKKFCFKDKKTCTKKRDERASEKIKIIEEFEIYMEGKEAAPVSSSTKRYKPKEVKEKKNEADKRHRIKEEDKSNAEVQKEQLSNQGSQQFTHSILPASGSLASEVAKARQHIKQSLQCMDSVVAFVETPNQDLGSRVTSLEKENQDLRSTVQELKNIIERLDSRVKTLEGGKVSPSVAVVSSARPTATPTTSTAKDDDDGVDLFGSDSEGEDAEAARIREERLAAYAAKKSKKPVLIAKSNIILDVKPWDDETDMKLMEAEVRKIQTDGLLWGAAKLVPLAFGIHKLQISCVIEDDKVSVDWLTEKIQDIEDYIQSVDIAAFNKV